MYLTLNLAKSKSSLNAREILIACASIDAVSASTSMAYSDKDVLASRKLVYLGFIIQITAFITEALGLSRLRQTEGSACVSSQQHPVFSDFPGAVTWTYLTVRIIMVIALVPITAPLTEQLDIIERTKGGSLQIQKARQWELLPASLFTNYVIFFSFVIMHAAAAFSISSEVSVTKSWETLWTEWGQSASFVVAIVVVGHVCSSFCRLFSSESLDHRVRVATAINSPTSWATPRRIWRTPYLWRTLRQRQPFGKIALNPPDGLLINYTQLLPYEEQQIFKTEKEKMELWAELLLGFELNDREGIMDCLARGAPIDRHDKLGEYPIHKAARFGDIYMLQNTNLPMTPEHLLKKNNASEMPLKIAVMANRIKAVRWILEHMKQIAVTKDSNKAVMEAFDVAIMEERDDLLVCLLSLWPDWRKMARPDSGNSHVHFAIINDKVKAAEVLIAHGGINNCKNEGDYTQLEYAAVAGTENMIRLLFKSYLCSNESISIKAIGKGLERGHLQTLLNVGIDPSTLFTTAIREGLQDHHDILEALIARDLSSQALDFGLTCLESQSPGFAETQEAQRSENIKVALACKGARSWVNFLDAAKRNDYVELERMLDRVSGTDLLDRMITASSLFWRSALHATVVESGYTTRKDMTQSIAVLLKYGADVKAIDEKGDTPIHIVAYSYNCTSHLLQLLKVTSSTDLDRVNRSGHTVLCCACAVSYLAMNNCRQLLRKLNALLTHGANPSLVDAIGRTPLQLVLQEIKRCEDHEGSVEPLTQLEWGRKHITILFQNWEAFHRDPTIGSPQNDLNPEWDSESEDGDGMG